MTGVFSNLFERIMSQSEEAPWVKIARSQDWDTLNVLLKRTEAESVQKLIKGNEMGRTALSYALRKGAPEEIVMTMLDLVSGREGRSFLGSRDRFMFTALHHAAGFCSNIKILKKLVDLVSRARGSEATDRASECFTILTLRFAPFSIPRLC